MAYNITAFAEVLILVEIELVFFILLYICRKIFLLQLFLLNATSPNIAKSKRGK